MAKIIPDYCETTSHGEKIIFDLFRLSEKQTPDWVVIHSQNLRKDPGDLVYNPTDLLLYEADYLVLIPDKGVYILEVKGGKIGCIDGSLTTTNAKAETKKINPTEQAKRYKHALINFIDYTFGEGTSRGLSIDFAVVFPQCPSPVPSMPDLHSSQIFDSIKIQEIGLIGCIENLTRRLDGNTRFDKQAMKSLLEALRPNYDLVKMTGTQLRASEATINKLTSEQYERLDDAQYNRGMMFVGAAGTGKTTLAQELFSRNTRKSLSTGFFCYNKLLGKKLEDNNKSTLFISKKSRVGTFHSAMNTWIMASKYSKELIAAENDQTKDSRAFFDEIFPELAMKAVEELKISFDHIIIDEAQDILSYKNLLLLDKLIAGGLSKGSWTFFGDFEQQSIYESARSLDEVRSDIMKISGNVYAVGRLKINCRNSAKIATETAKVSGFEKAPTKNLNLEGADVIFQFYKANTEQAKQVSAEIIRLKNAGLVPSDIVILSNKRLSASGANGADSTGAFQIVEVNQTKWPILSDSQVAFCTIKSFKGLEAKAVIICDLEKIDDKEAKSLIYVGMSRAKSHLTVFSGSSIRDQIVEARNKTLS
jgi:hypothetical protein